MNMTTAINYTLSLSNNMQNTIIIMLEMCLLLGIIWLISKKSNNMSNLNLTETEEESILRVYKQESLVENVSKNHYALTPMKVSGKIGPYIQINGTKCVNFSNHDYFGLIGNSDIEEKVMKCIDIYGVGSCGPRGFYGTTLEHLKLEQMLADIFKAESSIVYSYGFATLSSAIPAYAKKTDIIFADEKCNFAIQKGITASKSDVQYFKHNDVKDFERLLESQHKLDLTNLKKARSIRRYLVVEGISLNTGRISPLPELLQLCKQYKVRIFVDESVSFGTLGETGRGITEYFGMPLADIDLIMGSFEFALASVGGFCAGPRALIDHQQVSGLGYCFSASLPPLLATAVMGALQAVCNNPDRVLCYNKLCHTMHHMLNSSALIDRCFYISGDQDSPVHVISLKNEALLSEEAQSVIDRILTFAVSKNVALTRTAILKEDTAMTRSGIRITTNLSHSKDQISHLVQVLEKACKLYV